MSVKGDSNLYEVIHRKSGYCFKMYYDIDLHIDKHEIEVYNTKMKEFISILHEQYSALLLIQYPDNKYNPENIIILDA